VIDATGGSHTTRGQTADIQGVEVPDGQWDSDVSDDVVVPGQLDLDGVLADSGRQTRTAEWHVAYWDDVLWWVTDRLDRIDPQLWRVAP
jgi:hypothetical protein